MENFVEIKPNQIDKNPFELIGKEWMLVTAGNEEKANTMTASWGGMGVMWGKDVVFAVIRPNRYTKEFIDNGDTFSLTFFDKEFKEKLGYLGAVSGRDEDKITKSELTLAYDNGTPFFTEGNLVVFCKKLFAQEYKPESFIADDIAKWYPLKDYHTLYIAEITKVLSK